MGLEKYQPTEPDIAGAEREMTSRDKTFTGIREDHIESIREAGEKAGIEINTERISLRKGELGELPEFHIEGMTDGHHLSVRGFPGQKLKYRIAVDGVDLDRRDLANDLFKKYFSDAYEALSKTVNQETANQEAQV